MPGATTSHAATDATPTGDVAAYLVERNYHQLCEDWDTRRVRILMVKLGDTPPVMAARLRIKAQDFQRRMETDCWTKQDELILTILEREVDFLKGGMVPVGRLIGGAE